MTNQLRRRGKRAAACEVGRHWATLAARCHKGHYGWQTRGMCPHARKGPQWLNIHVRDAMITPSGTLRQRMSYESLQPQNPQTLKASSCLARDVGVDGLDLFARHVPGEVSHGEWWEVGR